jgi:glycosyltransferase 2 family protein
MPILPIINPLKENMSKDSHNENLAPTLSGWRFFLFLGTFLVTVLGYILYIYWAGLDQVEKAFREVGLWGVMRTLIIAFCALLLRFCRWQIFLKKLDHTIPWFSSLRIFFSGFALSVTPAKTGELIRAFFLKEKKVPYQHAFGLYFSERLSDVFSVLLLACLGLWHYPPMLVIAALFVLKLSLVFSFTLSTPFLMKLEAWLVKVCPTRLKKMPAHIFEMLMAFRSSFSPKIFLSGVGLGVLAWGLEGTACYFLLTELGAKISLHRTLFIYGFSLLVGAATLMPAGVGGAELVMANLFRLHNIEPSVSAAVIVMIRLCTLWFSVLLGLIAIPKRTIGIHHKEI